MALVIGKIKCFFCSGKAGFFHSVHAYGIYGDVGKRLFYHPECLEMIEQEPEKFGHILADKAIHINELKERNMDRNVNLRKALEEKVEKLHRFNFERMMPRKRKS